MMTVAAIVFAGVAVAAGLGVLTVRTDARRFDHLAAAAMILVAIVQATLALFSQRLELGTVARSLARIDAGLWVVGCIVCAAFVLAFPLGRAPARWVCGVLGAGLLGLLAAVSIVPGHLLGTVVATGAVVVVAAGLGGGLVRVRTQSHSRGASALLVASASTSGAWAFVGATAVFADVVTRVAPTPPIAMAARGAPLLAAMLAALAIAHYAMVSMRQTASTVAGWSLAGIAAVGFVAIGHRVLDTLDRDGHASASDFGVAAVVVCWIAIGLGVAGRGRPDAEAAFERFDATGRDLPTTTRQTLLALERLTDPLAVQERVVEALSEFLPGARLELLRARIAPRGTLAGTREVSTGLAQAAVARGYVARHQVDELSDEARASFEALGGALIVPVRCGPAVFGVLHIDHPRIDREVVVGVRRFADLLGYKLETHRLYGELETQRRLASLGTLATAIAHDLRSPLSAIRMNLQMLERHREALGPDAESVEIAIAEADRLNAQIDTMLDFARPLDLEVGTVDIRKLLTDAAARVSAVAQERSVRIDVNVAAGLEPLPGDTARLSRVIVNLVENAAKASKKGGRVSVEAFASDDGVDIVVRDHGEGIAAEDLPRIFDPFFTTRADGTGLGLAISRKIVGAHDGRILVSSEAGKGSEFRVHLPGRRTAPRGGVVGGTA